MDEKNYNKIYKKLMQRFIIASLLFLSVFFLKQIIIHYQIVQEENAVYNVNIAGRQRMLSQKIVKDIVLIQRDQTVLVDKEYRNDLEKSLALWKKSHYELLDINETEEFSKNSNSAIDQMFQDIEPVFLSILNNAEGFQQGIESGEQDNDQLDIYVNEIIENEAAFLEQMDDIVGKYETEARESLKSIVTTHMILFLIIIAISIFITFKIFIPLLHHLKNAFLNVNQSNKNILKMFQTMKGAIFVIRRNGEIFFMNDDAKKLVSKEEKGNETLYIDTSINWIEFDVKKLIEKVKNDDNRIEDIETKIEDIDGIIRSVILSAVAGSYREYEAVVINLFDVTAQKKAEELLQNIATRDKLTGLYNRHFLESIIEEEFERAQRYEIPFSFVLLDLDHFKKVNDQWGHPVGDSVLQLTAKTVENNIRKSDYAIRIGGEEFLIIMPNTNAEGAVTMAEKVRKVLEETSHPVIGNFTASFGVAERTADEKYINVYNRVDEALYQAKENGRNCVRLAQGTGSEYTAVSFKWNPKWNCGEAKIDEQHRELFRMTSQLSKSSYVEDEKQSMVKLLDELIHHIITHFEYEETILLEINYKDIYTHKKLHAHLIERAQIIKNDVEIGELDFTKAFIYIFDEIILGHLLSEDVKFYQNMQSK